MAKGDYEVGHGKPPKKNQFKPGQSGNPSGRPKKMKSEWDHLTNVLAREYKMQGPEGPVSTDGLGVIVRRVMKDAADGKANALKLLFDRIDLHQIGREEDAETLTASDERVFDQYVELLRKSVK